MILYRLNRLCLLKLSNTNADLHPLIKLNHSSFHRGLLAIAGGEQGLRDAGMSYSYSIALYVYLYHWYTVLEQSSWTVNGKIKSLATMGSKDVSY